MWLTGSKDDFAPSMNGVGESMDIHFYAIEGFTLHSFIANLKDVEIGYGALQQVESLLRLWSLQLPVAKNVQVISGSIGRSFTSSCLI